MERRGSSAAQAGGARRCIRRDRDLRLHRHRLVAAIAQLRRIPPPGAGRDRPGIRRGRSARDGGAGVRQPHSRRCAAWPMSGYPYAQIRTTNGRTLATFGAVERLVDDVSLTGEEEVSFWQMLRTDTVEVSVPIVESGVQVGRFVLIGGMPELQAQLVATAAFTASAAAPRCSSGCSSPGVSSIASPVRCARCCARWRGSARKSATTSRSSRRATARSASWSTGSTSMLGDIRERDERLEAHARNLEDEVRARTADLRVARDAAEAANRAKSRLPRDDEPRNPHADEWHHGHGRSAARHASCRAAARLCRRDRAVSGRACWPSSTTFSTSPRSRRASSSSNAFRSTSTCWQRT